MVPWVLQLETEEALLRFLAGVADGDGTYQQHGRLQLYIGKEPLLQGVIAACLRLGIVPQVTRNRTIANVQIVERLEDILFRTQRVDGKTMRRKYGVKLFSARALFQDAVSIVDRQGRVRSAVQRNVLYSDAAIRQSVLPNCPVELQVQIEQLLDGDLRMAGW